jgi:dTDP-glucose 4,6-dehydratase
MSLRGKSVLVTGAGGFLGSHLAERLVREGARVRALVHYNARANAGWLDHSEFAGDMEIMAGDVCDPASCETAIAGCEIIYNLAALTTVPYSYRAPASFVHANIDGTLCMLEAARRVGVERFIQTSSSQTYRPAGPVPVTEDQPLQAPSPYAATKIACDGLVDAWRRSYGVPGIILKIFPIFGPRQSVRNIVPTIVTQLLDGPAIRLGNLEPRKDYIYVDDTIDAYVRAGTKPDAIGATFNICGDTEISIGDLAKLAARLMGSDLEIIQDTDRARAEGRETERLLGDSRAAQERLGWRHQVSLEDGLRKTISWYREHRTLVVPAMAGVFI